MDTARHRPPEVADVVSTTAESNRLRRGEVAAGIEVASLGNAHSVKGLPAHVAAFAAFSGAPIGMTPLPSQRGHTGSRPVCASRESLPCPLHVGHVGSSSFLSTVNPTLQIALAANTEHATREFKSFCMMGARHIFESTSNPHSLDDVEKPPSWKSIPLKRHSAIMKAYTNPR